MKRFLAIFAFNILPITLIAGQFESDSITVNNKLYIGLDLTTVTYHIYYDEQEEKLNGFKTGYFTPITLHAGYAITDRLSLQTGLGYGGSKDEWEWSLNHKPTDPVRYKYRSVTHVLLVPVSAKFTFLKTLKRFPVYGTFTLMPSFGHTKAETDEITDSKTTTTVVKAKDMNVFATGGLGFNYRISKRFTGYAEYLFYKHNLTGRNSFDYDWEQASPPGRRIFKSLATGVNYKL
jgi:hypothetical protein